MRRIYVGIVVLSLALVALLSLAAMNPVHSDGRDKSGGAAEADAVTMATAPAPDYPHDMKAAVEFLQNPMVGYLATVEDGKPRVRAWSVLKIEGETIYFSTDNTKAVFQQLEETPYAEYVATDMQTFKTLRVSGEVVFVDDMDLKKKAIESNPMLQKMYSGEREKAFQMFYMRDVELSWFAFSQAPEEVQEDLPE
jgi:uncharacterized pyridoxamine 5'-phosphate oxidase family protein